MCVRQANCDPECDDKAWNQLYELVTQARTTNAKLSSQSYLKEAKLVVQSLQKSVEESEESFDLETLFDPSNNLIDSSENIIDTSENPIIVLPRKQTKKQPPKTKGPIPPTTDEALDEALAGDIAMDLSA